MLRSLPALAFALAVACGGDPDPTPPPGSVAAGAEGSQSEAPAQERLALLHNPISLVIPEYHQGLVLLERGLREGQRDLLVQAEARLLEALRIGAARDGASAPWILGDPSHSSSSEGAYLSHHLVGSAMYLAWVREQLGDPALRDHLLGRGLVDPVAYAFHFDTRAVDEVIRFEQLNACFTLASTVQGALERWRADHAGMYPETLQLLVPDLLPAVPSCPDDGTSYEELYERLEGGRDFQLRCHAHEPINGGPLCVGPHCGAAVHPALEQSFKIYPMLLGTFLGGDRRDTFLPTLLERAELQPGDVVADIGAGAGMFTIPFAQAVGAEGQVYAVDINASVLAFVKARGESYEGLRVETVHSVRPDVTLPEASVDVAFIIQTYHAMLDLDQPASPVVWVDQTGPWMRTVHQAIKPGGRLIIQDGSDKMDPLDVAANLASIGFLVVAIDRPPDRGWDQQYIAVFERE